jgi:hypothetical protein
VLVKKSLSYTINPFLPWEEKPDVKEGRKHSNPNEE